MARQGRRERTYLVQVNGFVPEQGFLACPQDLHNVHATPEHLLEEEG